jgi:hypothetical protein
MQEAIIGSTGSTDVYRNSPPAKEDKLDFCCCVAKASVHAIENRCPFASEAVQLTSGNGECRVLEGNPRGGEGFQLASPWSLVCRISGSSPCMVLS